MKYLLSFLILICCTQHQGYSQKLSNNQKLYATCKVWGFLKYYHPKVADGKYDWDQALFDLLPKVDAVSSKDEFSELLFQEIHELGKIKNKVKTYDYNYFNKNFSLVWVDDDQYFSEDLSATLRLIEQNRHQGKKHYVAYHESVNIAKMINEKSYANVSIDERRYRLLSLFRYWNFVEYFFPYKYQTDENWDSVLMRMIPLFVGVDSDEDYHLAMLQLIAYIDDSHGYFVTKETFNYFGKKFVPFRTTYLNNQAIVCSILDDSLCTAAGIQLGDVITKINGEPIIKVFEKRQKYITGSNQAVIYDHAHEYLFKGATDSLLVELERNGKKEALTINRYLWREIEIEEEINEPYEMVTENIAYVNLGQIEKEEIGAVLDEISNSKAIIFDIRHNAKGTMYEIANFITSSKTDFFLSTYPDLDYPGKFIWDPGFPSGGQRDSIYTGKVILLVNENTQSHGEFTTMCLQQGDRVTTIGSRTSGADGNVTYLEMVGGHKTPFSGIGIFYPDSSETQRVGVRIDIEVQPTIEGIAAGRDEQLEKAIEVARD